uniref:Uncharacterized protein n=1 Tax=viral metagenome TaxID=1070528 RepID=A0A6C0K8U5_9ZZZZ
MSDDNELCEGLTTSNFICMNRESGNYTIHTNKSPIAELIISDRIAVNEANTEISLTGSTSNHYFYADEKAHCYEKWEDWFCIPNYHNNNKINNEPKTDTMSVGVCYSPCPAGYTQSKINKCVVYEDEEDLLYNPLAIIAMFGTNLYFNTNEKVKLLDYKDIRDTIGIRGSYLNDLYRVNNNNKFIPKTHIINIYDNDAMPPRGQEGISTQERIIIGIIKKFVHTGRNGGGAMNSAIISIKANINKAVLEFINIYVDQLKFSKVKQDKLLAKIKDYSFDTEKLDKIFGKDKCGTSRLKNVISYCYDISRTVFNSNDHTTIDNNIRDLFQFNAGTSALSVETQGTIIKIFKCACYNCFNANYDTFNTYLEGKFGEDKDAEPFIRRATYGGRVEYKYPDGFKLLEVDMDKLESVSSISSNFHIPYYNNITFYDHQLLAEYSENTQSVVYIILILAIFIGIIVVIWISYAFMIYFFDKKGKLLSHITNFINYCMMFYSMITFYLVNFVSYYYYYLLCKYSRSNYIIINLFFKFLNIFIIFSIASYVLVIILELLNMNLFGMLSKMNFNGGAIISDNEWEKHKAFYNYMLHLYLIGIYVYSMYITRYSLTDKEFDILTNVDSQEIHSANHINNLLLQNYSNNMLSAFYAVYDKEEIEEATEDYKAYIKERRSENAAAVDAAKEARIAEVAAERKEVLDRYDGDPSKVPYYRR